RPLDLEAELAARDEDGRAPDLDAIDTLAFALDGRIERRRPLDLGALADLDLLAEGDAPVPGEVDRERPGGRSRRGVLVHAVVRREHPRLPAVAVDVREAVDAVRSGRGQRADVRGQSLDSLG